MLFDKTTVAEIQHRWAGPLGLVARQLTAGTVVCERAHLAVDRFTHRERFALAFAGRAMHALHAVELLFSAGHPEDATSEMRTLAELCIDHIWIAHADTDARIRRFAEYIYVAGARREAARQNVFGAPTPETIEAIFRGLDPSTLPDGVTSGKMLLEWFEAEHQRVEANYKKKSSWSDRNIADRANDIGASNLYTIVHRAGSEASHPTATGLATLSRGERTGSFSVEFRPVVPGNVFPLMMSSQCFGVLLSHLVGEMGLDSDPAVIAVAADLGPFSSGWVDAPDVEGAAQTIGERPGK